jgi:AraC-like DNA-binding protein
MATATPLFASPDLFFAELSVPRDDPQWGEDNQIVRPIVALPAAPVWQRQDGAGRRLFNQNHVVFHRPGTEYRRERFRDMAYRCLFFFPAPSLLREIAVESDPSAGGADRLPAGGGPLDARTFALSRLAARYLRSGPADPASAREVLYEVLRGAVRASGLPPRSQSRTAVSGATRRARREVVEGAKEVLTTRMAEPVSLDDLARGLFTSPYHLARLFRAATGFSVHGYLMHLRLRTGLERMQAGAGGIGEVGLGLGYRSHSHFTASFRRAFGLTPSRMLAADAPAPAN